MRFSLDLLISYDDKEPDPDMEYEGYIRREHIAKAIRRPPYTPRRPVPQDCAVPMRGPKAGNLLAVFRRVVGAGVNPTATNPRKHG